MGLEYVVLGDVLINRWTGSADVSDVQLAFQAAEKAYGSAGPVTNFAVLAKDFKLPSVAAVQMMRRDHSKMLLFHRSVHYISLVEGFTAARLVMFISSELIKGTRGVMHLNKTAKEAMDEAMKYGALKATPDAIYRQLKLYGVPEERLGRAA